MTKTSKLTCLAALALLAGCEQQKAPTGQIVATVDGMEITASELQEELASAGPGRLTRDQALDSLVTRKILVAAARKADIDKRPATLLQQAKARDIVLISELSRGIHDATPQPDDDEVKDYVAKHPASFAERRVFILDQFVVMDRTAEQQLEAGLKPLKTLDQARALLDARGVRYARTIGTVDALTIDPDEAEKMAALPEGELIVSPSEQGLRISQVRETVTLPLPDRDALRIARETLWEKRAGTLTTAKINQIIADGRKDTRYNPSYHQGQRSAKAGAGS